MKKFLIMLIFLLASMPVLAFDNCMTGAWYSPDRNGEGITVEVLENQVVAYFYRPGNTTSRWYLFVGDRPEADNPYVKMKAYSSTSSGVRLTGTGSLFATGNHTLEFSYEFKFNFAKLDDPDITIPWCLGCWETLSYSRLTTPIACN